MLSGIALGDIKQTTLKNKHSFNELYWKGQSNLSILCNSTLPRCERSEHNRWEQVVNLKIKIS